MSWIWVSTLRGTVAVEIVGGKIAACPPYVARWRGRPAYELVEALGRHGGLRLANLDDPHRPRPSIRETA